MIKRFFRALLSAVRITGVQLVSNKKMISLGIFAPFIAILGLGLIATVTGCGLFYNILKWIAVGAFMLSISIAGLKLSNFSKVIGLKNPIGHTISILDFAGLAAMWGIFALIWLALPAFTGTQNFIKGVLKFQEEALRLLKEILEYVKPK